MCGARSGPSSLLGMGYPVLSPPFIARTVRVPASWSVSAPSLEVICPCTRGLLLGSRSCPVGLCVRLCATAATYGPLALRRRRVVGLHLCALMCTHHLFSFDQSECPLCVVAGSGHGDLTEGNCASPKCRRERRLGHFRGGTSGLPLSGSRATASRKPMCTQHSAPLSRWWGHLGGGAGIKY